MAPEEIAVSLTFCTVKPSNTTLLVLMMRTARPDAGEITASPLPSREAVEARDAGKRPLQRHALVDYQVLGIVACIGLHGVAGRRSVIINSRLQRAERKTRLMS